MNIKDIKQFNDLSEKAELRISINKFPGDNKKIDFTNKLNGEDLSFSCWNLENKKRFLPNMINLVFIKVGSNSYLFVAALKIISIPEHKGPCEYIDITSELDLSSYARKLIIKDTKAVKTQMGAFIFKKDRLNDLDVESYDGNAEWSKLKWNGYDKINLSFQNLYEVIESERHIEYKTHLTDICGVYLLTDTNTGMKYVGSAYGEEGIAQRWKCYIDTGHGGNKLLKELYNKKGIEYFKKYFTFNLLYHYPLNTAKERVIERESFFKEILGTRETGYNAN